MPTRRRIAIIGGGISGLGAAWLLRARHDVRLFERAHRVGGHTHTVLVDRDLGDGVENDRRPELGGSEPAPLQSAASGGRGVARPRDLLALDTGFIVYNPVTYPLLARLLEHLGVATRETNMSFSVRCERCDLEYSGLGAAGLLADPRNALRPMFLRMLLDVWRFGRWGRNGAIPPSTLGELVEEGRFGDAFARHYLLPLASALWSTGIEPVRAFPLPTLLEFFRSHRLLHAAGRLRWRTVVGGSRTYVDAMLRDLRGRVHTRTPVRAVERGPSETRLHFDGGGSQAFDRVVIATHADQALALLVDPTPEERRALGPWRYSESEAWLHTDEAFLSRRPAARASWNYRLRDCQSPGDRVTMTYNLNRLQRLPTEVPYLVTLNPARPPRPARVLLRRRYRHPMFTPEAVEARRALPVEEAPRRTHFCGAYRGFGFHEDGLRSGVRVADALGAGMP